AAILAEQTAQNFRKWFDPLGIETLVRTGERKDVRYSEKKPTLVIGTHALLSESFALERLGLTIIDEQHKFGVSQRNALLRKGDCPHLLVMTATPIPRTLGLTVYGDLDMSVIDQLPAGRGRIRTFIRNRKQLPKVIEFIKVQLAAGRQAYIVYSRLSEADTDAGIKA